MMTPLPLLVLAVIVAGCATETERYPSLAPRAVEKVGFGEPAARPAPEAKPDPALDARIVEFGRQLETISTGFARDAAAAERAAGTARGQAVGSEAWINAQTALAQLDDWRSQASSLVTDIEGVAVERAAALAPAYPDLTAIAERAQAEAEREAGTIDRIQAGLPSA